MGYEVDRLRGRIREKRYTEKQMAEMIGVSQTTFSSRMNKKTSFELEEAIKLSKILNVSLDELFMPANSPTDPAA